MGTQDIFKKSFLENFNSANISTLGVLMTLLIVLILSIYVFFIYRVICRKSFYNKNFNISLVALALITAGIIITIQSSIVVSLGMVGALSIVRFRTAVKDPLDLVFLFWAIAIGIICGVSLYKVAVIVSFIVTIVIFVLDMIPIAKVPYIFVVRATSNDVQNDILRVISKTTSFFKVKSRNVTKNQLNMVIELKTKDENMLINKILKIQGVEYVSLLDHDGEITY